MPPGISFVLALLLLAGVGVSERSFSKDHCKLDCNVAHAGADWLQEEKEILLQERSKLLAERARVEGDLQTLERPVTIGIIGNEVWRNRFKMVSNNKLMRANKRLSLIDFKIKKIEQAQETFKKVQEK